MPTASEPIVVNTSPLLALNACGQIELLQKLHTRVVVPRAVIDELGRGRAGIDPLVLDAELPTWLEVVASQHSPTLLLSAYLDEGEAAVVALALELSIPRVVIDERRGRMVARTMGLTVTGSIGVLLRAKSAGLVTAVKPNLEAMHMHGIWLSERLRAFALREAEEE